VELFRFSAVTFNAHRIHYDLPYAQGVEGYPALVVHGPLTAVKLLRFAADTARRPVRSFAFKQLAPLFSGQPVRFMAGEEQDSFLAIRCDGVTSARASVTFA
jgi:3-methylfumaryl-CoA hydratase